MFSIPTGNLQLLFNFLVVAAISLILGLEQRRHHTAQDEGQDTLLGTDRTFALLGIFGFILYILDPDGLLLFGGGGIVVSLLLSIYYLNKLRKGQRSGLTSILSALITYSLAPILFTQPIWLTLSIVVMLMVLIEMKEAFVKITSRFGKDEFIVLAKFILISGIILPNLPDEPLQPWLPVSPYKLWMALVISSGISYFSYLLKKFVFSGSGIWLAGFLGGLYSSTAVALIFSRRSRDNKEAFHEYASAVMMATAVMYLRILIVTWILRETIAILLLPWLLLFFLVTALISLVMKKSGPAPTSLITEEKDQGRNPLELRVALFFSIMYLLFNFLGHYAESYYGEKGLHLLSFLAGFADVDSYIMSLLQGKFAITSSFIATSIVVASTANNIIKTAYCLIFAEKKTKNLLIKGFSVLLFVNLSVLVYLFSFAFR